MDINFTNFILTKATNEELNTIMEYVSMRRKQIGKNNIRAISKGMIVTCVSKGKTYTGKVLEVKVKNLVVDTQHGRYRVPASMVTVVSDALEA